MKINLILLLLIVACSEPVKNTLILNYTDFGPQTAAYKLLGFEWWQWNNHGESRPKKYDIKVVIYKDIDLASVKLLYPVSKDNLKDYRYLKYDEAIKYLEKLIADADSEMLHPILKKTRKQILEYFL